MVELWSWGHGTDGGAVKEGLVTDQHHWVTEEKQKAQKYMPA